MRSKKILLTLLTGVLLPIWASGADIFGRVTEGGYFSMESLKDSVDASSSNNASLISSRFYLRAYRLGEQKWETVFDFRDKADFFDKLNQQDLKLSPGNRFQAYQLFLRLPETSSATFGTIGRFNAVDAGGDFVDGLELGRAIAPSWKVAAFGGLNSKRPDQVQVQVNRNSQVAGLYSVYQPKSLHWMRSTFWSSSVVGETDQNHLDRLYWYNHVTYLASASQQFFLTAYLDTQPVVRLQSGLLSYHQDWNDHWSTTASATSLGVVEYTHRQSVLERLASSPYREGALNIRRLIGSTMAWDLDFSYGKRQFDGLKRAEAMMGPSFKNFGSEKISFQSLFGARHDFVSNDAVVRASAHYESRDWDAGLSSQFASSFQPGGGTLHKWTTDLELSQVWSRSVLSSLALQRAQDEKVQLWAAYLRVSYTFGQKDLSPLQTKALLPQAPTPEGRL